MRTIYRTPNGLSLTESSDEFLWFLHSPFCLKIKTGRKKVEAVRLHYSLMDECVSLYPGFGNTNILYTSKTLNERHPLLMELNVFLLAHFGEKFRFRISYI